MSMRKRRESRQEEMFVQTSALPDSPGHPFYTQLNELLAVHGFDLFVEERCSSYYAETLGRPSIPPGVYFRMLMIGYFEGLGSERGIDWRVADSLALRQFLGYALTETTPDHSSLSRIRQRLPLEVHQEVFNWVLKVLALEGLLKGKSVAVDATTLEANAALRSIVRRDTGEDYDDYLKGLAQAEGIETPTRQDLAKLDKKRPKKGSNDDWQHPHDPDARITKMKDGRTPPVHRSTGTGHHACRSCVRHADLRRVRWRRGNARRSWTCSTKTASWTERRRQCTPPCWRRDGICARSARCTGCCTTPTR